MELFESSWEVCNKVGGIHTVLKTKADNMQQKVKEHYYIGPYRHKSQQEFEEEPVPKKFSTTFKKLESQGIKLYYGTWKIPAKPKAILVDFSNITDQINGIKGDLWERYAIDSLHSGWEFEEPILWSTAVGRFLETYSENKKNIVAHFHEWMAGAAILYLKSRHSNVKTVFTTHATILGRTISSNYGDLSKEMEEINPDEESTKYNIQDKHLTEKACAWNSDVFTTVSHITGIEAEHLLKRKPDIILLNGIDTLDLECEGDHHLHSVAKKVFPDLKDDAMFVFTSGRYEFHDKGMDVFIDALAEINGKLNRQVVAFFLVPIENFGIKQEYYDNPEGLMCTHYLKDEFNDIIIKNLREKGLDNKTDDEVKVLFIPTYINKHDGFFNCTYYDIISECDLGVFPSIYEPWGYTPLECASLGIPSVTTENGGFGRFVQPHLKHNDCDGVFVLKMEDRVGQLIDILAMYLIKERDICEQNSEHAKELAELCSWDNFVENYMKAYELALK